jgi:hypothetical protein
LFVTWQHLFIVFGGFEDVCVGVGDVDEAMWSASKRMHADIHAPPHNTTLTHFRIYFNYSGVEP